MSKWSIVANGIETQFSDLDVYLELVTGAGMPALRHLEQSRALLPGALIRGVKVEPRVLQVAVGLAAEDLESFHSVRKGIVEKIAPQTPIEAVQLRYYGNPTTLEIDAHYEAGFELSARRGMTERTAMRFICYDPFFRELVLNSEALTARSTLSNYGYIFERDSDGDFSNMDQGANGAVRVIRSHPSGDVYAAGSFSTIGTGPVTVNYVARNDGADWYALGTGPGMNNTVEDIAFLPDGRVVLVGTFTDINGGPGGTYNRIVIYDPVGDSFTAVGTGLDDDVWCVVVDENGDIIVGGDFLNAGGGAAVRVARFTITWAAMDDGLDDTVLALAIGFDGTKYAAGAFLNTGADPVVRITYWDESEWQPMRGGLNGICYALCARPGGGVWAAGAFTQADGDPASKVVLWHGNDFQALGDGVDADVKVLVLDSTGLLHIGGQQATAAGITLPYRGYSVWDGYSFAPGDFEFPTSHVLNAMDVSDEGYLWCGGDTSGSVVHATKNTVDNQGTADAYPVFRIRRDGGTLRIWRIANITTGKNLYFDLDLQDGEELTIDLELEEKSVETDWRGNTLGAIVPASDLASFVLIPGNNLIYVFTDATPTVCTIEWYNRHWSIDGPAT